ncbi:MAG TPA: hypothetical protein VGE77_04670, partial [Nocardioides sp.]
MDTDRTQRALVQRIERLERLFVGAVGALAALLLVAGLLAPYIVPTDPDAEDPGGDDDLMATLLVAGFRALGYRSSDGDVVAFSVLAGIGFLGLLVVVLVALGLLWSMASGGAGAGTARAARVVAWLLGVGTGVAGLFELVALGDDNDVDAGPAVLVLAAGVALFVVVVTAL